METIELATPAALVDLDRLEANCAQMRARCAQLGVQLRPHVKTHKCPQAARIQHGGEVGPITVSTVAEARGFAAAGFRDIAYAVPAAPSKLDALAELAREVDRLRLDVDHPATADAVEGAARRHGVRLEVVLEVDCGDGRCGVDPDDPATVELAKRLVGSRHLEFAGLMTHGGQSYRGDPGAAAVAERDRTVGLADRLRAADVEVREVSVGSTPSVLAAEHLTGVTEVRPGNYALFDAFQVAIGSCALDEVAVSVLAEVISVQPERRQVVIDAGALALSVDPGPRHLDPDCGFGVPCGVDGSPLEGWRVVKLSQEHGVLRADADRAATGLAPGDRLRILPNHSCLAVAGHAEVHVVSGSQVVDTWRPIRGW